MIQYDNIEVDLTALYCFMAFTGSVPIAFLDAHLIKQELKLGFWFHTVKTALLIIIAGTFLHTAFPTDNLWYIRIIAAMLMYSVTFDMLLNALRGKELFYIGKTAYLDKLAQKLFKTGLNYAFWRLMGILLIGMGIMGINNFN